MAKKNLISIIIVNYNTGNFLKQCLENIFQFSKEYDFEVIVVDNASSDNSEDILKALINNYNNFKYIQLQENLGFSKANNIGFKNSQGDYILFLNPDIQLTQNVIPVLIKFLDEELTGAISPLLVDENNQIQYNYYNKFPSIKQFVYFYSFISKFFGKKDKKYNKYLLSDIDSEFNKEIIKVEQLPGAFFFTKRRIFEEIGLMNEKYFLFFDDVDLSFRMNKRYNLILNRNCKVKHIGGASFNIDKNPLIYGYFILSMNIFFDLNYSFLKGLLLKFITVLNSLIILSSEYLKSIIKKHNDFRIKKHKYFFKLFLKHYFSGSD